MTLLWSTEGLIAAQKADVDIGFIYQLVEWSRQASLERHRSAVKRGQDSLELLVPTQHKRWTTSAAIRVDRAAY